MEYVTLTDGRDAVRISRLIMGCEPLGGVDWGRVDPRELREAVARSLDEGVTTFDTADVYGLGESERALAAALGNRVRDAVIITKGGVNWAQRPGARAATFADLSPRHLANAVEGSLRRLGLESLPVYFMHRPDSTTHLEDTLDALLRCREQGKLRLIGASNFPMPLLHEAHAYLPLAAVQGQYNLIDRVAEHELLPLCRALHLPMLAYGALAQGLLGGRYDATVQFDRSDRRHRLPQFADPARDASFAAVRQADDVARTIGRTTAQVSVRWVLEQPGVAAAIVGAKRPSQALENAGACGWLLGHASARRLASSPEAMAG